MYGGMCYGGYLIGVLDALDKLKDLGIKMYYSHLVNESLITRGRNKLVHQFLGSPAEYLIFIDSDIVFQSDDIIKLLAAEKDIICGLYPKKRIDWNNVRDAALRGEKSVQDFAAEYVVNPHNYNWDTPPSGVIEVKHSGTGFMCIHRRVFEKLYDKVPEYRESTVTLDGERLKNEDGTDLYPLTKDFFALSISEDGLYLSEDYHFCELWRSVGGKIYADLDMKLRHIGTHVFDGDVRNGFNPG